MTRKQELLEFIEENINDQNKLRVREIILSADRSSNVLKTGSKGYKNFSTSKDNLIQAIRNGYSADLQGHAPGDPHLVRILGWEVIPK